jgi:hypothetical protein
MPQHKSPSETPPFDPELLSLPDDEMIAWVWTWWIAAQMEAKGIPLASVSPQLQEIIWLETLNSDTDNESNAGLEKAMKLIAQAKGAATKAIAQTNIQRAAKMFRERMMRGAHTHIAFDEAATGRRKQRERAKKPREDALSMAIRTIVEARPDISSSQLMDVFRRRADDDDEVIEEVADEDIFVIPKEGGASKRIKIASIPDRLNRAKRKVKKSKSR